MTTTLRQETVLWGFAETLDDDFGLRSVQALLFGELVKRAAPVTKHFLSDLFHDAEWIKEHVTGEITFDFLVREWGTHIGHPGDPNNSAVIAVDIGAGENAEFYRVHLFAERRLWKVAFTRIPLSEVGR